MSAMKSLFTGLTCVLVILPIAANADVDKNCSDATLQGSYGMHATGSVSGIDNFATVGRFTFDGKGSLTGKLLVRMNGSNVPLTVTGTYSVSSDCTFSDVWNLSNNTISTHESVIVDEGKGYFILATTGDGAVRSGEAKKQ